MAHRWFAAFAVAVSLASADAQQFHDAPDELIDAAIVADGRIFATSHGQLRTFALDGGDRSDVLASNVIGMDARDGQLWVVRDLSAPTDRVQMVEALRWNGRNLDTAARFAADGGFITLAVDETGPLILTHEAFYRLEDGAWRRKALAGEIGWHVRVVHLLTERSLYVGFDNGEWGGGLRRIELDTGAVVEIQKYTERDACSGPLYAHCSPVTALIADRTHPSCLLAAVGLSHFLEQGAVLRVCGDIVVSAMTLPSRGYVFGDSKIDMTQAVYGLAPADDGYWLMTRRELFLVTDNGVRPQALDMQVSGALLMARPTADLIVLGTNLRATVSLSGTTPLLVSIPPTNRT